MVSTSLSSVFLLQHIYLVAILSESILQEPFAEFSDDCAGTVVLHRCELLATSVPLVETVSEKARVHNIAGFSQGSSLVAFLTLAFKLDVLCQLRHICCQLFPLDC